MSRHLHIHLPARRAGKTFARDAELNYRNIGYAYGKTKKTEEELRRYLRSIKTRPEDIESAVAVFRENNGGPARDAAYYTCPECEANFAAGSLSAGKLPAHKFLGNPCPGSGTMATRDANPIIAVKAIVEGWNYGPQALKRALEAEEHGDYPTEAAAKAAARAAGLKLLEDVRSGKVTPRDGVPGLQNFNTEVEWRLAGRKKFVNIGYRTDGNITYMTRGGRNVGIFNNANGIGQIMSDAARDHRGGPFPTVRMAVADAFAKRGPGKVNLRRGVAGGVFWDCSCAKCAKDAQPDMAKFEAWFKSEGHWIYQNRSEAMEAWKNGLDNGMGGSRDADPQSLVGKMVRFRIPYAGGAAGGVAPTKNTQTRAGFVQRVLPDGRIEVKGQDGGYYKLRMDEIEVRDAALRDAEKFPPGTVVKYARPQGEEAQDRFKVLEDHRDATPPRVRIQSTTPMSNGSRFYPIEVVAPEELVRA